MNAENKVVCFLLKYFPELSKDIHCLLSLTKSKNIKLNGIENVKELYDLSVKDNLGKQDFSATIKTVKKIAKS